MSEFKKRFQRWMNGEKVYEAGKILPEVVITPDEEYNAYLNTLPDNQRLTPNEKYDLKRYWELGGKPKDFDEAVKREMFSLEKDGVYHANSVRKTQDGDYEFMKPNTHPTKWMEDEFYDNDKQFQKQYRRTLDWTRPGFSKYERNINPLDHINLPKYDGGTSDKTYLPEYEYEATVTPQGTSVEKHKRITNEEDWLKYWGNVGAGYVNKALNEAAPYVLNGMSMLMGNPIGAFAGIGGSILGSELGAKISPQASVIGGIVGGFASDPANLLLVRQIGKNVANSRIVNKVISPVERRIAYIGSRGAKYKNFNPNNPLDFYANRTDQSVQDIENTIFKLDELPINEYKERAIRNWLADNPKNIEIYRQGYVDKLINEGIDPDVAREITEDFTPEAFFDRSLVPIDDKSLAKFMDILDSRYDLDHMKIAMPALYKNRTLWERVLGHENFHLRDMKRVSDKYNTKISYNNIDDLGLDKPQNYRGFDYSKIPSDLNLQYLFGLEGTELGARGHLLKDYFGLLKGQRLTPRMLKYAAKHYVQDIGFNNNMTDLFNTITDYKKATAVLNNLAYDKGRSIKPVKKRK